MQAVVNRLSGHHSSYLCCERPTRIEITVKAREVAARDLQPDAVSLAKHHAGWPQ